MSQFGNRIVVPTASVNYRQKVKEDMDERESCLNDWEREKYERLQRLRAKRDHYKVNRISLDIITNENTQ